MSCIFCDIAKGYAPAEIFMKNADCVAIVPINIEVDGHLLVLPTQHYETILDIPRDLLGRVMGFVKEVCVDLQLNWKFSGFNFLNASGAVAGQSVQHFHVHILPRNDDDGIDAWPDLPGGMNIYEDKL